MVDEERPNRAAPCAVLVDYDNFFVGDLKTAFEIRHQLNRMVSLALSISPVYNEIEIRLYGGWMADGLLSSRGSELQAATATGFFPIPHPSTAGLLRGSVTLVTRLEAVPQLEWRHTYRTGRGLPRLRIADGPRPDGCAAAHACPIDHVQRISRRRVRECHVDGCSVTNESAFLIQEQKMVDSMVCCDAIALGMAGSDILVLSDDLDVLPAVAMAAVTCKHRVVLVRSSDAVDSLYSDELADLGVDAGVWEAA